MKIIKFLLVILIFFSQTNSFASSISKASAFYSKKGVLDLRKSSFSEKIPLNGEWYFYWNQLLSPRKENVSKGTIVDFPMTWNKHEQIGKKLPAIGYASYSLTVLLPKLISL